MSSSLEWQYLLLRSRRQVIHNVFPRNPPMNRHRYWTGQSEQRVTSGGDLGGMEDGAFQERLAYPAGILDNEDTHRPFQFST